LTNHLQAEYDFVVVGGGLAGLAAGVAAADRGMRVAVLEKSATFGGVTAYSNGQLWVPGSHLAAAEGIQDSPQDGARYLRQLGMGFASEPHIQAYVTGGPSVVRYFEDAIGLSLRVIRGLPDYYHPDFDASVPEGRYLEVEPFFGERLGAQRDLLRTSPHQPYRLTHQDMWELGGGGRSYAWDRTLLEEREKQDALCMGTGIAAYFLAGAIAKGVDLIPSVVVTELVTTAGRVAGVRVEGHDGVVGARAGVLLATGGYDWDSRSMNAFEGIPGIESAAPPTVVGDHLRLAARIGARTTQLPKPVRLGYRLPGRTDEGHAMTGIFRHPSFPHAILVNRAGQRFCDESFYPSIGHALKIIDGRSQQFVNWPCWMVFDQEYRDTYAIGQVTPGDDLPAEWDVQSASTIGELAGLIGVDAEGLQAQVARFNSACADGVDPEFKRGARPWSRRSYGDEGSPVHPNLGAVATAPFYAMRPTLVGTGIPTVGLDTEPSGQVIGADGVPVPGLYAAGNSSALLETGAGYQSGVANTRSLIVAYTSVADAQKAG
jgi:3-oxosteroid 1-dehydrogenase